MANIEHWTIYEDGRVIDGLGAGPFPYGHVLVKLADRNKEVYELGVQLAGAVSERDALQIKLDRVTAAMQDAADLDPVSCRVRVRAFLSYGGQ
jgi:hypothetical protein